MVIYPLMIVTIAFCAVVGYGVSSHANWAGVVLFSILAVIALQFGYLAGAFLRP